MPLPRLRTMKEPAKPTEITSGNYTIGSSLQLTGEQIAALISVFSQDSRQGSNGLNGRGSVVTVDLPEIGRVVVKSYRRGGFLRHFISNIYVRSGAVRAAKEFHLLREVREMGVPAPEPVAYASAGGILYRTWLVTREVSNHKSLAEISILDEDKARVLTDNLVDPIGILIKNKIFHIDLHPGNVVVDGNDTPYFLDFDKAYQFSGTPNALRDKYLRRWRRAVIKHQLPEVLSEVMCMRLRTSFE